MIVAVVVMGGIACCLLALSAYWMRCTTLLDRSTAAYRRGDIAGGDRLRHQAERWSIGTGIRGKR